MCTLSLNLETLFLVMVMMVICHTLLYEMSAVLEPKYSVSPHTYRFQYDKWFMICQITKKL